MAHAFPMPERSRSARIRSSGNQLDETLPRPRKTVGGSVPDLVAKATDPYNGGWLVVLVGYATAALLFWY